MDLHRPQRDRLSRSQHLETLEGHIHQRPQSSLSVETDGRHGEFEMVLVSNWWINGSLASGSLRVFKDPGRFRASNSLAPQNQKFPPQPQGFSSTLPIAIESLRSPVVNRDRAKSCMIPSLIPSSKVTTHARAVARLAPSESKTKGCSAMEALGA